MWIIYSILWLSVTMVTPATRAANHSTYRETQVWYQLDQKWGKKTKQLWLKRLCFVPCSAKDGNLNSSHKLPPGWWFWPPFQDIFSFSACFSFLPQPIFSLIPILSFPFLSTHTFQAEECSILCHDDTNSASHTPSMFRFFQQRLTLSVCLISPDASVDGERMPLALRFYRAFFPTLSLPLTVLSTLVPPIQASLWLLVFLSAPLFIYSRLQCWD